MKMTIQEAGMVFAIYLQPESLADSALLARLALNARMEPPEIYVRANGDSITADITLAKVAESAEQIYIKRH